MIVRRRRAGPPLPPALTPTAPFQAAGSAMRSGSAPDPPRSILSRPSPSPATPNRSAEASGGEKSSLHGARRHIPERVRQRALAAATARSRARFLGSIEDRIENCGLRKIGRAPVHRPSPDLWEVYVSTTQLRPLCRARRTLGLTFGGAPAGSRVLTAPRRSADQESGLSKFVRARPGNSRRACSLPMRCRATTGRCSKLPSAAGHATCLCIRTSRICCARCWPLTLASTAKFLPDSAATTAARARPRW